MAIQNYKRKGQYSYQDIFDTQTALESGDLASASLPTTAKETTTSTPRSILGMSNPLESFSSSSRQVNTTTEANKDTFGSILGMQDSITANRKRRQEQSSARQQGTGVGQSILGGGAF